MSPENREVVDRVCPDQLHTLELHGDAYFHISEIERLLDEARRQGERSE